MTPKSKTKSNPPAPTPPLDPIWPYRLNYQQKLQELGRLLAAIYSDVHTPDTLKAALHQAVSGLREQVGHKKATTLMHLEALHLFPAMAWAMGLAVEDVGYDGDDEDE